MLQTHNEGPDNSGILRRGAGRYWSSSACVSHRFVALKVTFASRRRHRVIATVHFTTQRDEATNLRLQRLNDVMAAKMRSSSIEPKPADEEAETAGLDLMSLLVNPDSFCETAENFFDLSFLVKDARATVGVDDTTGLPVCRLAEAPDGAVPKTQNVVVLSMADCKAIGELWGIEKPQLPREDGARERAQAAAQRAPPPPPDDGEESDAY